MGFLFKFLLGFMFIYIILKSLMALLIGKRGKPTSNSQRQQTQNTKQPENQQERIIDYQRKNFESSEIEDVDFVEIQEQR